MIKKIFSKEKGNLYFKIFAFLLVSIPTLSSFFLILSIISSSINRREKYFEDKWNLPFLICGLFLIFIALIQTCIRVPEALQDWSILNSWLGLANWLPYFFLVWVIQPYLSNYKQRRTISILLLSGSMPLFFSIFGQYWFKLYGPFNFLNGFIIWYQRPILSGFGATGFFNNQNYTAVWLLLLLPLSLALIREPSKSKLRKFLIFLINTFILISIYLTQSRSGWIGTFIGTTLIAKSSFLFIILSFFIIFITILILALVPIIPSFQKYAILVNLKFGRKMVESFFKRLSSQNIA